MWTTLRPGPDDRPPTPPAMKKCLSSIGRQDRVLGLPTEDRRRNSPEVGPLLGAGLEEEARAGGIWGVVAGSGTAAIEGLGARMVS